MDKSWLTGLKKESKKYINQILSGIPVAVAAESLKDGLIESLNTGKKVGAAVTSKMLANDASYVGHATAKITGSAVADGVHAVGKG